MKAGKVILSKVLQIQIFSVSILYWTYIIFLREASSHPMFPKRNAVFYSTLNSYNVHYLSMPGRGGSRVWLYRGALDSTLFPALDKGHFLGHTWHQTFGNLGPTWKNSCYFGGIKQEILGAPNNYRGRPVPPLDPCLMPDYSNKPLLPCIINFGATKYAFQCTKNRFVSSDQSFRKSEYWIKATLDQIRFDQFQNYQYQIFRTLLRRDFHGHHCPPRVGVAYAAGNRWKRLETQD